MPKFIGNTENQLLRDAGRKPSEIVFNHCEGWESPPRNYRRVKYATAKVFLRNAPAGTNVFIVLDTTDRGSRGSYAKRWYRWFIKADSDVTQEAQ